MLGGYAAQVKAIGDAIKNEQWDQVITQTFHLTLSILALSDNCFTGDTLVAAENGQVRIDEIEVGDSVWAYDIFTGETALKEVTKVYVHEVDEILHLHTTAGDIDTTTNHPFYVIDRGWVAAGDLDEGDEVYLIDGSTAFVTGAELEKLEEPMKVYNLEVADFNTYFVGDEAVLVHNYDRKPRSPKSNVDSVDVQDGKITYTKTSPDNGQQYSVTYNEDGFPDFSPYRYSENDGKGLVKIDYSGDRYTDFNLANQAAGFPSTPDGYTWHHLEDMSSMELVLTVVHKLFPHTGGFALFNNP